MVNKNNVVKSFREIKYSLKNLTQGKETPYSLLKEAKNRAIEKINWKLTEISLNRYLKKLGKGEKPVVLGSLANLEKTLEQMGYMPKESGNVVGDMNDVADQNILLRKNIVGKEIKARSYDPQVVKKATLHILKILGEKIKKRSNVASEQVPSRWYEWMEDRH